MDIINLPMDEFNDLLSKHELTEEQLTLCRDIRLEEGAVDHAAPLTGGG